MFANTGHRATPTQTSRSQNDLKAIPSHLLADCGFEAAESARQMDDAINRMCLTLNSLR